MAQNEGREKAEADEEQYRDVEILERRTWAYLHITLLGTVQILKLFPLLLASEILIF